MTGPSARFDHDSRSPQAMRRAGRKADRGILVKREVRRQVMTSLMFPKWRGYGRPQVTETFQRTTSTGAVVTEVYVDGRLYETSIDVSRAKPPARPRRKAKR